LDNEIKHVGILGMHWGQHKSSDGISSSTHNLAKKDAKRYVDAKMFYGKTAGTQRKLLNAELEKKKRTIPGYEKSFNMHIDSVDRAKSAKKAVSDRNRIDNMAKGRSLIKSLLGVTGSLTVGVASMAYYKNKPAVDAFVASKSKTVAKDLIYAYKRFKVSNFH